MLYIFREKNLQNFFYIKILFLSTRFILKIYSKFDSNQAQRFSKSTTMQSTHGRDDVSSCFLIELHYYFLVYDRDLGDQTVPRNTIEFIFPYIQHETR